MGATDHSLKRLVALAGHDFATWLLGVPVQQVGQRTVELTADPEPIDTDQVLWVERADGRELLLHIEFQGPSSHKPMPLRLLDYLSRLAQTYRDSPIQSVVLYLWGGGAHDSGTHQVIGAQGQPSLTWSYTVIRLWQMEATELLALDRPGLLALIGLTRIARPEQVVPQAIGRIGAQTAGELRQRLLEELLLLCKRVFGIQALNRAQSRSIHRPQCPNRTSERLRL